METLSPQEVAARIARRPATAVRVAAALDDWAQVVRNWGLRDRTRDPAKWKRLLEAARLADPDPWRSQLRQLMGQEDLSALRKLADASDMTALPVQSLQQMGNALIFAGDGPACVAWLRKAHRQHPGDALISFGLAFHLSNLPSADAAEALRFAEAGLAAQPSAMMYDFVGNLLYKLGRHDEAIACYHKAIEVNPNWSRAHKNLGSVFDMQGKLDESATAYREAIRLNPKGHPAYAGLGFVLMRKGDVDGAIACYRKAIELQPDFAWAHNQLGNALARKKDFHGAIAAYQEALRFQPNHAAAHFGLASALEKAKQWDRSASVYSEALQRFGGPLWPGPWYEPIRSDEVFTRLTALRPDDRLPWIMRARVHVFERDWKRAAADYARASEFWTSIEPAKLRGEGDDLMSYACLLLLLGDRAGYEQFCKQWADRVGPGQGWEYSLGRAWALSPQTVVPAQRIVNWARKTLQNSRKPWELHVVSLALYRNGKFDLAIERAKESNAGYWRGGAKALNELVLAMAHHRLGHTAEARTSLEHALELADRKSPDQPSGAAWADMTPADVLEVELLRREVEDLINPESIEKPDQNNVQALTR